MQKDLNFPRNHKSLRSSAKSQKNMNEKKWRCNRGRDGFRPSYYYLWICFKNSTLYIHPDSAYTPHTHTHTNSRGQVAAQQSWSIWKALSTDTTPASEGCLHSSYLGEQQQKKAFHLHPFLRNKELESVCHETDIPFVLLRAMQRMLI